MSQKLPTELEALLSSLESSTFYGKDYPMQNPPGIVAGSSPFDAPFRLTYSPLSFKKERSSLYQGLDKIKSIEELQFEKDYSVKSYSWKLNNGADLSKQLDPERLKTDVLPFDPRWIMRAGEYMEKVGEFGYKFKINHVEPGANRMESTTYAVITLDDERLRQMDIMIEFGNGYKRDLMSIEFRKNGFRN